MVSKRCSSRQYAYNTCMCGQSWFSGRQIARYLCILLVYYNLQNPRCGFARMIVRILVCLNIYILKQRHCNSQSALLYYDFGPFTCFNARSCVSARCPPAVGRFGLMGPFGPHGADVIEMHGLCGPMEQEKCLDLLIGAMLSKCGHGEEQLVDRIVSGRLFGPVWVVQGSYGH